jgi:LPXTG-motif cell wall-anchored protein
VRFFDADNSRRVLWVIENRSDADIDVEFFETSFSQCDGSGFGETSAGWFGTVLPDEDVTDSSWFVQREEDSEYGQCGVEAKAWQSTDTTTAAEFTTFATDLDRHEHNFAFTLPEGETYGLAFFYADFWVDDNNESFEESAGNAYFDSRAAQFSAATAYADDNWTTWSDSLATGLDGTIDIINWNYDAPELAETGFDSSGIALTGVVLAAAGTAIVVRRRVRA